VTRAVKAARTRGVTGTPHAGQWIGTAIGSGVSIGASCADSETPQGRERARMANFKHGFYTAELVAERRRVRQLFRDFRSLLARVQAEAKSLVRPRPSPDSCRLAPHRSTADLS